LFDGNLPLVEEFLFLTQYFRLLSFVFVLYIPIQVCIGLSPKRIPFFYNFHFYDNWLASRKNQTRLFEEIKQIAIQ